MTYKGHFSLFLFSDLKSPPSYRSLDPQALLEFFSF